MKRFKGEIRCMLLVVSGVLLFDGLIRNPVYLEGRTRIRIFFRVGSYSVLFSGVGSGFSFSCSSDLYPFVRSGYSRNRPDTQPCLQPRNLNNTRMPRLFHKKIFHLKLRYYPKGIYVVLLLTKGSRKKSSSTCGPTTKRGEGGKGRTTKEK